MPVKWRQPKQRIELSINARRWLLGGSPRGPWHYLGDIVNHRSTGRPDLPALWAAHREAVVQYWARRHPGTRPRQWWKHDAPEPRKRLGGIGTPLHECSAYALWLEFGVPVGWRRRDEHDFLSRGISLDPANPPRYESEASYLRRLGLLLPGERKRLSPRHFWPEAIT
jgi:hypothetical protein